MRFERAAMASKLWLALAAAGACAGPAPGRSTESTRSHPLPQTEAVVPLMKQHFEQVVQIRDAVIAGDLAQARVPAAWLAEHGGPPTSPPSWEPYRVELRRIAGGLSDGATAAEAAKRTAEMAAICGLCHRAAGVHMERDMPALVEELNAGTGQLMKRHRWAVDRLWEGLVVPSDTAWTVGAGVLADAPLDTSDVANDGPIDPRRPELIDKLHRLGDVASSAKLTGERAALLGELLGTCSGCHRL
jgi:cytochrome c553